LKPIRVLLIGAGKGGSSILDFFLKLNSVKVVGVADINLGAPGIIAARHNNIPVFEDFKEMISNIEADVIIEATGEASVKESLRKVNLAEVSIMEAKAANLMMNIVEESMKFYKVKETKELLQTILNSAQEGIQVADKHGKILYVNKAFTRITKIPAEERIGKNVFQVSPDGALSEVLRTQKPVFGKPNVVKGSDVEVVSNASPIMVNGKMTGAVVVFRDITDMKRIIKKLNEREEIIKTLKGEIVNLTSSRYSFDDLIGESSIFKKSVAVAKRVSQTDSTVLITGESGTGKELFAHAIHGDSPRKYRPFIKVNCAAIPASLLESELFGYEKGAFTGAEKRKMGKFELASGGSIFLDEIGDMDLNLQAKILRVLQEKEIERIGGNESIKVDVRVIAATNRDLFKMTEEGRFRKDLYYRLNVIRINIPSLRERREDIPVLIEKLMEKLNQKLGKKVGKISREAVELMMEYSWPGNVRELENVLERAITLADGNIISADLIRNYVEFYKYQDEEILSLNEMEKRIIKKALNRYGTSLAAKKKIAGKLNISLATLYNKIKKYGIEL